MGYGAAALGAAAVSLGIPSDPVRRLSGRGNRTGGRVRAARARDARTAGPRGAPRSTPLIRRLAGLFALDSFAGGFVLQSLVAYFLHTRFDLDLPTLGRVFFVAQILTAASLLLAPRLARTWGLLPTMVVTHLVSNVFLIAIAFAPVAWLAIALLLANRLLSQIDVPTRQAYVMAVVPDREREAAATTTTLWRTSAQAITPLITGWVMQALTLSTPFLLGGGLKIVYDVLLYRTFKDVRPGEAARRVAQRRAAGGLLEGDGLHLLEVGETVERLEHAVLHERRHALVLGDLDHLGHARLGLDELLHRIGGDQHLVDGRAPAVAGVVAGGAALAAMEDEVGVVVEVEVLELVGPVGLDQLLELLAARGGTPPDSPRRGGAPAAGRRPPAARRRS